MEKQRLKNIKDNEKKLKDLGFAITKRKFDRHVPNKTVSSSDEYSEDDIETNLSKDLLDGEELYLLKGDSEIFKAKYQETQLGESVHGKVLQLGEGRFFILKVLRGAIKWGEFDPDVMCNGAAIIWRKSEIKRRLLKKDEFGTEALTPTPRESRKRKRQPENWKTNIKKRAVNEGKDLSYTKKNEEKTIKKREMKLPCNEKCRIGCSKLFSEEERQKIFEEFYALGDKSLQSTQLASLVIQQSKNRTRKRKENNTRNRQFSRTYHFFREGRLVQVCAKMFLNTFSIDEKRVRTVLQNKTETGAPIIDGRGRHGKHKTCQEREDIIMKHIKEFNVIESHYVRKDARYEYLPHDLSVAEMYRMYNEWRLTKNYQLESYDFYLRVFKEKFNLKFQSLKKDRCDTCETFRNLDITNKTDEVKKAQANHLKDKDAVREIKEKSKISAQSKTTMIAAAFDLQKVLLTPFGQTGSFFYSRRLANYNFTVTEINNMNTTCYFWSEFECQKGSCEIATSIQKFINNKVSDGFDEFCFFCDRCGGQNNNRMMFIMLSSAMTNNPSIKSITLTYLVSGHSHSENDNAHSLIEQMSRKKTIYTPAEWETIIKCSFKKNVCDVIVLEHKDIIDFKNVDAFPEYKLVFNDKVEEIMSEEQKKNQRMLNENMNLATRKVSKIYWSEIVEIKFISTDPEMFFFKYSYDEIFRCAKFSAPKRELRKKEIESRQMHMRKYTEPSGISQKKKEDLIKLCNKQLIPQRHHAYYKSLPVNKKKVD